MQVVLASGNAGKLAELVSLLGGLQFAITAQSELGVVEAVESGLTFVENALIKARNAASVTGLPALADDSGLVVPALQGAPGVYSARYAGPQASDRENVQKLLGALDGFDGAARECHFVCVMVYLRGPADPLPIIATGVWHGHVLNAARGSQGFGYDPIFHVPQFECSAAELDAATKNRVSHRGQAVRVLVSALMQERAPV
jgi:XTP/dITP diphosphohydrolase